jgi:hypothetical protein
MLQLAFMRATKTKKQIRDAARLREAATQPTANPRRIQFLNNIKRENPLAADIYAELCEEGCDTEELLQLWHGTCRMAGLPKELHRFGSETDYAAMGQAQIKNFLSKLNSWADEIERLNRSALFSPGTLLRKGIQFAREEDRGELLLDADLFESLPKLLRGYAITFDFNCRVFRKTLGPGTFSSFKLGVYQFVDHVKSKTKLPKYGALSEMLCAGFDAIYPHLDHPHVFNQATLKRFYLRAGKIYRHFPSGRVEFLLDTVSSVASKIRLRDTD